MNWVWWRLLAAFSLILVAALLRGQDADRLPVLALNLETQRYFALVEQVRPPVVPVPRRGYPVFSGSPALAQITRLAGIIFSGRVTSVGRAAGIGHGPASTTVTFQVEQAMRGVAAGESVTIREWAGLWNTGERYRVGERVFLFLYSPSKLGLTSPVAGAMGRFAVDSRGTIMMSPLHMANLSEDAILGGKTVVRYADFELAVQRASREQ